MSDKRKIPLIDLNLEYREIKKDLDIVIKDILNQGRFHGGHYLEEFEEKIRAYTGAKHCIPVASGHDALFVALKMMDVGIGDEVITTAYSWISTANAISQTGADPVFVDIDPGTFNIDVKGIESNINEKTKAILPVHLYGLPAEMDVIMALAKKHNLIVLEDAAQAMGATYKGKMAGTTGDAGIYSFYPTKPLGAYGDAGCIITDSEALAEKCRTFARHGMDNAGGFVMKGINSRMDSFQAAVLSVKMDYLESWLRRRREIAGIYREHLREFRLQEIPGETESSCYNFPVVGSGLKSKLEESGIEFGTNYQYVIPNTDAYNFKRQFPVAEELSTKVVTLPIFPQMRDGEIKEVVAALNP